MGEGPGAGSGGSRGRIGLLVLWAAMKRNVRILLLGEGRRWGRGRARVGSGSRARPSLWGCRDLGCGADRLPRAAQVGKTSLILSLVSEEFPEEVRIVVFSAPLVVAQRKGRTSPGHPHGRSASGPTPSRRDHYSRGRHPREGAHSHRGFFR